MGGLLHGRKVFGGLVGFDLVVFDLFDDDLFDDDLFDDDLGSPEGAGWFVLDLVNLNLMNFDLVGPEAV